MVNVKEFKEQKKNFITVMDVMNAKERTATITEEATIQEFKSVAGNTFKKLIIPVLFEGQESKLGVYADVSQRIALMLGEESTAWIGARLHLKIAGSKTPYITVDTIDKNMG